MNIMMTNPELVRIGRLLGEKINKEIAERACKKFNLGYTTEITVSPQAYALLEKNADVVSEVFEKEVKDQEWAENMYRIQLLLSNEEESKIEVRAFTRRIITSAFLDSCIF